MDFSSPSVDASPFAVHHNGADGHRTLCTGDRLSSCHSPSFNSTTVCIHHLVIMSSLVQAANTAAMIHDLETGALLQDDDDNTNKQWWQKLGTHIVHEC